MLGQKYTVGDHVVYATTSGRSPVQKFAIVEKVTIETRTRRVRNPDPDGAWTIEQEYEHASVGVRELKNGRGFSRSDTLKYQGRDDDGRPTWQKVPARVTYPMTENIVKVPGPETK